MRHFHWQENWQIFTRALLFSLFAPQIITKVFVWTGVGRVETMESFAGVTLNMSTSKLLTVFYLWFGTIPDSTLTAKTFQFGLLLCGQGQNRILPDGFAICNIISVLFIRSTDAIGVIDTVIILRSVMPLHGSLCRKSGILCCNLQVA